MSEGERPKKKRNRFSAAVADTSSASPPPVPPQQSLAPVNAAPQQAFAPPPAPPVQAQMAMDPTAMAMRAKLTSIASNLAGKAFGAAAAGTNVAFTLPGQTQPGLPPPTMPSSAQGQAKQGDESAKTKIIGLPAGIVTMTGAANPMLATPFTVPVSSPSLASAWSNSTTADPNDAHSRLYVGGFESDVPAQTLQALFAPFGTILRLDLPSSDINPALSKGYCFVWFADLSSAKACLEGMNGFVLLEKAFKVSIPVAATTDDFHAKTGEKGPLHSADMKAPLAAYESLSSCFVHVKHIPTALQISPQELVDLFGCPPHKAGGDKNKEKDIKGEEGGGIAGFGEILSCERIPVDALESLPQGHGAPSQVLIQQGLAWDAQLEFKHKASAFRMLFTMTNNLEPFNVYLTNLLNANNSNPSGHCDYTTTFPAPGTACCVAFDTLSAPLVTPLPLGRGESKRISGLESVPKKTHMEIAAPIVPNASVKLENMISEEDMKDPLLKADIYGEASKHGELVDLHLVPDGSDGSGSGPIVFLLYAHPASAAKAQSKLNGRFFGGKALVATVCTYNQ